MKNERSSPASHPFTFASNSPGRSARIRRRYAAGIPSFSVIPASHTVVGR
jgi:hypothetical protein